MKYILISFLFIALIAKFLKRFNSSYVLNSYIGKKGHGKSTIGVKYLLKYMKKGYTCYTDLDCNLPGIHKINMINLSKFKPVSNSFIWIDESGITFDNRQFKTNWNSGLTEFFKLQRHYKVVVFMSSQAADYDLKLKNLCDNIYLVRKIGHFLTWIRPIGRQVKLIQSTAEADSRIAEDLYYKWIFSWRFVWLPKYWKYFNSFSAPYRPVIPSKVLPCAFLQDFQFGIDPPDLSAFFYIGDPALTQEQVLQLSLYNPM